jgi:peptidoglycan/LPS O-acetylase OafA/YrhL
MTDSATDKSIVDQSRRPTATQMIVLLEALRFVTAIGVVLYHYQHFVTYTGAPYEPSEMPYDGMLGWFYRHGGTGVQVFWLLSGTVFAHVYQTSLVSRTTTIVEFLRKRFARLYPLHFTTLLLVAGLIFVARKSAGLSYVIYQHNDMRHFVLNLLFAQYWGFESGTSFNGPSWSVSIEMIAYAVFLLVAVSLRVFARVIRSSLSFALIWLVLLLAVVRTAPEQPGYLYMCIVLFFTGALTYSIWREISDVLVAILVIVCCIDHAVGGPFTEILVRVDLPFGTLTVGLVLCLMQLSPKANRIELIRRTCLRLGSMTYAIYLCHFPIQILMILWSENIRSVNFLGGGGFATFFVLLLIASAACYDWFEAPVKRLVLRSTLRTGRSDSR